MPGTATRPFAVILIVVLLVLAALFNLAVGVWMLMASFGVASTSFTDHLGNAQNVSGFALFVNGALYVIMGFIYFWLLQLTMAGSATAHLIISMFAVINIVFALFSLPFGWGQIIANVIVLLLVNTSRSKAWFSQTA